MRVDLKARPHKATQGKHCAETKQIFVSKLARKILLLHGANGSRMSLSVHVKR